METKEQYLLEAKNLSKYFPVKNFFGKLVQEVRAVDRVNLSIKKGETFGLVGESGCGKSTLGRTLIRMYEPTDGILTYDGHDITKTKGKELLAYHKRMQIIFQDPYSALDPHQNVREIMAEPISVFEKLPEKEMDERIVNLLEKVGMKADDMEKYAMSFQADSVSVSVSQEPYPSIRNSCSAMSRFPHWTYRSRHRLSTCWKICSRNWD